MIHCVQCRYASLFCFIFFNDTSTTEIYTYLHTLSLHDALPICLRWCTQARLMACRVVKLSVQSSTRSAAATARSEEHTSELQSLMRISYAVFCLKKTNHYTAYHPNYTNI